MGANQKKGPSRDNERRRIRAVVWGLIVLFVLMFLSGFLKGTPFEHISILLFALLFGGGLRLVSLALKTELGTAARFSLAITALATTLFVVLIGVASAMSVGAGLTLSDALESIEGLFYLTSALFLSGVAGSLVFVSGPSRANVLD